MTLPPLFHTDQKLGAVQIDGGTAGGNVQFRLFFPEGFDTKIAAIRAAGDFQTGTPWDFPTGLPLTKTTTPDGDFWAKATTTPLATGFYQYKYQVTFTDGSTRVVTDPCARYSGTENQNSGFVIGGSQPASNAVTPLAVRKPLRDLIVYEVHPDDFTDEFRGVRAPFDATQDKLQYLVSLGVNAILLMPWTSWVDKNYDWGYAPFQYFAVEYAYANDLNRPEEKISWLKKLISACHASGIHVIMDGVFNHCSTDFAYKQFYLDVANCPYTQTPFGGTFPGLQDLDFTNGCTQDFIRDVCLYWIDVFGIDGIRFDNTVNYYVAGTAAGIPGLLDSIDTFVIAGGQTNFSTTLEHLDLSAAGLVNATKATSYWDNELYGECFYQLWWDAIRPNYLAALNNTQYVNGPDKVATTYLSNHDHSAVAWQAGARSNDGSMEWYRTQPHVIALLMATGTPLIAAGQEFAEDHWIPEDDKGTSRRIRPRPLRWKETTDSAGGGLLGLYQKLCNIRNCHPGLRSRNFHPPQWTGSQLDQDGFGVDTGRQIVVFHRWGPDSSGNLERFIIALNFSGQRQAVTLQFPANGAWFDMLSGQSVTVTNYRLDIILESYWGHIFFT
jgi:glycosidase